MQMAAVQARSVYYCDLDTYDVRIYLSFWGGEIAQSLASVSTKRAIRVRAHLDPLVIERWNSITVIDSLPDDCFKKGHPCVIMSV